MNENKDKILHIIKKSKTSLDQYIYALYRQTRMTESFNNDGSISSETSMLIRYAHTAEEISDQLEDAYFEIEHYLSEENTDAELQQVVPKQATH